MVDIIVVYAGGIEAMSPALLQQLKFKLGNNIKVVTPEEAADMQEEPMAKALDTHIKLHVKPFTPEVLPLTQLMSKDKRDRIRQNRLRMLQSYATSIKRRLR